MDSRADISVDVGRRLLSGSADVSLRGVPGFISDGMGKVADRRGIIADRRRSSQARSHAAADLLMQEQLIACQERERTRIASDLHDSIGSSLSAVKLGLEGAIARLRVEAPQYAAQPLTKMVSELKRTLEEVRRISMNLRPSILDDLGIVATIGWYCRELETLQPGVHLEKQLSAQEKDVPDCLKTAIFRILQEASNNTLRHAGADLIRITLSHDAGQIRLVVEDNGRGFDILDERSRADGRNHCGIASMRQRARSTGGSLAINSAPGAGTRIIATWQGTNC